MNARENFEAFLTQQPLEWIPTFPDTQRGGGSVEYWELGELMKGGPDGFGTEWIATESTGFAVTPDSRVTPITDICEWESQIKFPDLDAIDWEAYAESQTAPWNRDEKMMMYSTYNSIFERVTHLLGFEEGLCAFVEEPEATMDLCNAITDYKIDLIERVAHYIKPDVVIHYDDVATARNLFTSPEIYREFIKPCHKRLNDAISALGMYPTLHCCGYCAELVPDFIEEGNVAWFSADPSNDIASLLAKYGDKISISGGYDTQGPTGQSTASEELVRAEVRRCFEEYAFLGKSFMVAAFIMGQKTHPTIKALMGAIADETAKCQELFRAGAYAR